MLSTLIKFFKGPINEGIWGMWQYKLPADKKQQMYDFYMLAYLLPPGIYMHLIQTDWWPELNRHGEKDEEGKDYGEPAMTNETKFEYSLQEAANILLPALKHELLEAVMFALAAETRHLYDRPENDPRKLIPVVEKELGPQYADMLKKYTLHMKNYADPNAKYLLNREKLSPNVATSSSGYKASYRAMKAAGGSEEDWGKLCEWLFSHAKWNGSYGGKAWADIASGWLHLYHSKGAKELLTYIDHVYDLQHNTDTVFNKLETYAKDGGYGWIKEALDHKRYLVSPHEMIEHVSPAMRELALIGIKIRTGKSWEDFEKDWPKILKQKADIHNQVQQSVYEKHGYGLGAYKNITPDQYAKKHVKASDKWWSVGKINQEYLKGLPKEEMKDAMGKPIKVGDYVKKQYSSQPDRVGKVTAVDQSGYVTVQWSDNYAKNYPADSLVVQAGPPPAAAPAAPKPTLAGEPVSPVHQSQVLSTMKFDIGDQVSLKQGGAYTPLKPGDWLTVTSVGGGKVNVKDMFGNPFSYWPSDLKSHKKAGEQPQQPWHGVGATVPQVSPKQVSPPQESPPQMSPPLKPAAKPVWAPPTPEEKAETDKSNITSVWNNLPKMSKTLKLARTVRGMHSNLSFDMAFNQVEKALNMQFTPEEKEEARSHYHEEDAAVAYYQTRGHMKFPSGMNSKQAWDMIQTKFPDAPNVIIPPDVSKEIEDYLRQHENIKPIATFRKATQFSLAPAKGWVIYKKLEMYMTGEIKD